MARPSRPNRPAPSARAPERPPQRESQASQPSGGRQTLAPIPAERLIFGLHAALAAWCNPKRRCRRILVTEGVAESHREALAEGQSLAHRPPPQIVTRDALAALIPDDSVHQGILLETDPLPDLALTDILNCAPAPLLVLDQVTDPHNVGAILRSAAAFGVAAVITQDRHAPPIGATLAKAACGGVEHVPVVRVVNLVRALEDIKAAGWWVTGLSEHAPVAIGQAPLTGAVALVLGNEGDGLRRLTLEACDHLVRLPTDPQLPSLNVSNACAIALYEIARHRTAGAPPPGVISPA